MDRRKFIKAAGLLTLGTALPAGLARADDNGVVGEATLPFPNGGRELAVYPQKRPLIRFSSRPPQLETPFSIFNKSIFTPNDAFFVRYHLAGIPTNIDPKAYRLRVKGKVSTPLELTLDDLKGLADPVELNAVNQCSGNSRGFFVPRVGGGQSGNGTMGNARWKGIPLKTVLEKAGVSPSAVQVSFEGMDRPVLPTTPEFVKALDIGHAMDGEVMLGYEMNGQDLPMLNGYPVRLIVPGYYGTYWVKHLADIEVLDHVFTGFWMATAYRIPDNPTHSVPPGTAPKKTIPINRFDVRSFITSLEDNDRVPAGKATVVRGIAFDGGSGIQKVSFSQDGGASWTDAALGRDYGRYSFREWKIPFTPSSAGAYGLQSRATSLSGETQPLEPRWNPTGYMRNVVETVHVEAA